MMWGHLGRSTARLGYLLLPVLTVAALGLAPAATAAPPAGGGSPAAGGATAVITPLVAPAPPVAMATQDSLRLTAQPEKSSYAPGDLAIIDVTATNTGSQTLEYWLPTPCDTPFQVNVALPAGQSVRLPRKSTLGQPPTLCIQVVQPLRLAPGGSVSEQFAWDTGAAEATAGSYMVTVAFNAHSETDAPNTALSFPLLLGAGTTSLSDIRDHWAATDIMTALQVGFVNGYPDGTFRPEQTVTRAELLKMLVLARNLTPVTSASPSFNDVATHWVETQGYLEAAVQAGFLHPADYGDKLNPDQPLTREETAVLIVRAMGLEQQAQAAASAALTFTDRSAIGPGDAGFIATATTKGIIKGYEDETFRPERPVTRAEAVTMLLRMQKVL